jgi:outer membrane immunogenic protein
MSMLRSGVIGLALVAGLGLATMPAIAEGGPRVAYDQPYYYSIWQGLYAGVHVGFGDADGANGFIGGGQIGYSWQAGRIIYGVEADVTLSGIEDDVRVCAPFACAHASASLDWFATVRGRIGYLVQPHILAYATAGFGFVSWSADAGITGCPGCEVRLDGTETDFVVGLGAEMKLSATTTGRIEYLNFEDADIIRAGLNFKLGN